MEAFIDKHSGSTFYAWSNTEIFSFFQREGICEYNLIRWCEQFLTLDGTFLDIGAHMGTYSILLAPHCKTVHSFEPTSKTHQCLIAGIKANQRENIIVHQDALGEAAGTATIYHTSEDGGSNTLSKEVSQWYRPGTSEEVIVSTLDSMKLELSKVQLIKIDVEGFELAVLKGAVELLKQEDYPPILFECWPEQRFAKQREELMDYLVGLGYRLLLIPQYDNMWLAYSKELPATMSPEQYHLEHSSITEICNIAERYRHAGKNREAVLYALKGLSMKPTLGQQVSLLTDLSICAFYTGMHSEGVAACEFLLQEGTVSEQTYKTTLNNIRYYLTPLLDNAKVLHHQQLQVPPIPDFFSSSGSLSSDSICIRMVTHRPWGVLSWTRNYLCKFDPKTVAEGKDLSEQDWYKPREMICPDYLVPFEGAIYKGLEDVRIFGNRQFLTTVCQRIPAGNLPRLCYGEYSKAGIVTKLIPLSIVEGRCEKNWLPMVMDDKVYFIYQYQPWEIYHLNTITGTCTLHKTLYNITSGRGYRGSAAPIPHLGGWLLLVHYSFDEAPGKRLYYHRMVWLAGDFSKVENGPVFVFRKIGVEFCTGLIAYQDKLILCYSVDDKSTELITIEKEHEIVPKVSV